MSAHQPTNGFIAQLEAICASEGRNELDIKECVRCVNAPQAHLHNS